MVKILDSFSSLSEGRIAAFEEEHAFKLPVDYRNFLGKHNGGSPEPATFNYEDPILGTSSSLVQRFAGIHEGQYDSLERYLFTHDNRVPVNLLPIARDWSGNLICLSINGDAFGKVYFWSHEEEGELEDGKSPDYRNVYFVSNSFPEFINGLYEFEISDNDT